MGVLLWQLGNGLFGLSARGSEGAPKDFTDHHMSHLLRLLSQARSLCVSAAFGNGGVVVAVGPALHTFPLDLCGEVQTFPASFSSSELSPHQMAPRGVIRALAESRREKSVRKCNFATFSSRSLDFVLVHCDQRVTRKRSPQA